VSSAVSCLRELLFIAMPTALVSVPDSVPQLTRTRPVPNLVAGSLLVLTLMSLVQASRAGAQGGKPEVFPVQMAGPAAVFIETAGSEMTLRRQ
jgi:hypothetical protein